MTGIGHPFRDPGLLAVALEPHGTVLHRTHHVGGETGRQDDDAVLLTVHLHPDRDRQVEVTPGHLQLVTGQLEPDTREHGERASTVGDGAAGGAQGLGQDVPVATELHGAVLLSIREVLGQEN